MHRRPLTLWMAVGSRVARLRGREVGEGEQATRGSTRHRRFHVGESGANGWLLAGGVVYAGRRAARWI